MAVLETLRDMVVPGAPDPTPIEPPPRVKDRIDRGRKRTKQGAAQRSLCLKFWRGEHNWYVDEKNTLRFQDTVTYIGGGGRPQHRVRNYPNLITSLVEAKVSAATQRVPGYEVNPSSFDPERVSAAALAAKVAVYGYDEWHLRRATKKWVTLALVADEGFVWPYYDNSIGPFVQDPAGGQAVGVGDVRIRVLSRNEVGWEPGMEFEESPYLFVEQARPLDEVYAQPGFSGKKNLKPDAQTSELRTDKAKTGDKLVLVTDYLERPCPSYPEGRWITIANERVIGGLTMTPEGPVYRPYPLTDSNGQAIDEPVLHRLSYTVDPDADQDMGLVRHLIDPQRARSDAWSKALEWKNRMLNPQFIAPVGAFPQKFRKDDTPGAINYYRPVGGLKPEQEQVQPIPDSLFKVMQQAQEDMQQIAASQDIPTQVDSAKALSLFIEQQQVRWQAFIGDLAEGHSRLMRHCLWLVQKHYTEERTLKIRGRTGWESISDFKGAQLMGESDVRVLPGSIESLTRNAIQERLTFIVTNFPGAVSPEDAQAALEGGTGEALIKGYELAIARANRIIQKLRAGPEVLFSTPQRPPFPGEQPQIDPNTGQPASSVPGWMPRPFDNIPVQKKTFEDWMQTDDFEAQPPPTQEAAGTYYQALLDIEARHQLQAAQQQQMMAQGQGMQNAAAPQGPSPMPSLPGQSQPPQGGTPASPQ